jgi:hypothetical protein
MTLEQAGPDVVATGSGTLDLAGLIDVGIGSLPSEIIPSFAILLEGNGGVYDKYYSVSGPTSFGPGAGSSASSGTGDPLVITGGGRVVAVPTGYVSGTPLSSTATWDNTTLAALGVTPGTYTWTWGSGADADSLTLYAGVPAPGSVPEPASAVLLTLGAAGLALMTQRHRTLSRKR